MKQAGAYTAGLRSCDSEQVMELVAKLRKEGYTVTHVTRRKDGSKLPYNGVLKYSKQVHR